MIFTDPPYNVDYSGGWNGGGHGFGNRTKIKNDVMTSEQFAEFMKKSLRNMLVVCGGIFYICMGSKELGNLKKIFEEEGGHWQSFIIWVKNTFTLSRSDWQNQYEPILYGWNRNTKKHYFAGWRNEGNTWEDLETLKPEYDGRKTIIKLGEYHLELIGQAKGRVINKNNQTDIWREKKPTKSPDHPTMKPIRLVAKAITASSRRDEIILDLFAGSGSTLIAAEQENRRAYLMEIDEVYCDVIKRRWEAFTHQKAQKQAKKA